MAYRGAEDRIVTNTNADDSQLIDETFQAVEQRVELNVTKHPRIKELFWLVLFRSDDQYRKKIRRKRHH